MMRPFMGLRLDFHENCPIKVYVNWIWPVAQVRVMYLHTCHTAIDAPNLPMKLRFGCAMDWFWLSDIKKTPRRSQAGSPEFKASSPPPDFINLEAALS